MKKHNVFDYVHRKIGETITVDRNRKIQFRDTGIYILSNSDGKLLISADSGGTDSIQFATDVTFSGAVAVKGTFSFGDAATDALTVNGYITYGASSADYLIDMNTAIPAIGEFRLSSGAELINTTADTLIFSGATTYRFQTTNAEEGFVTTVASGGAVVLRAEGVADTLTIQTSGGNVYIDSPGGSGLTLSGSAMVYGLEMNTAPTTAVMKIAGDQSTVALSGNAITSGGYLTYSVSGSTRYIQLFSATA